jgi:hypothetical protein
MLALLTAHPSTLSTPVDRIEVEVERGLGGDLRLAYRAFGNVGRIRLPQAGAGRTDGLWRSTCFEAFVRPAGGDSYLEVNASPSGQWATYRFERERTGMSAAAEAPGDLHTRAFVDGIGVATRLAVDPADADWRLGLSAVIEDADGGLSYWALAHPSDKPDFHHPDSFTLVVPAPGTPGRDPA